MTTPYEQPEATSYVVVHPIWGGGVESVVGPFATEAEAQRYSESDNWAEVLPLTAPPQNPPSDGTTDLMGGVW